MTITYDRFDFVWFDDIPLQKRNKGNQGHSQKYYYKDIITAFDIETTYIKEVDESVMYIWQWQFGNTCTVIGRSWYELKQFMALLSQSLGNDRLIIFVHNLSFEFQFLSGVFDFAPEDVFCMDHRKVLKALLNKNFEFRCSYLQTNMSLRAFCEKMNVPAYKLKLNYKKRRYWYTDLSPKELAYCINDVRGLVQAIEAELKRDGDNLYTIPLTSTGYARRDAKNAMRSVSKTFLERQKPSYELYKMLREAFRGGNVHASRFYAGKKLENLGSRDIASSYPTEILTSLFPVSAFQFKKSCTKKQLEDLIYVKQKAVIMRIRMFNVELKNDLVPVPYIPVSKCRGIYKGAFDNGRVLSASVIAEITLTDIDYNIIKDQYNFDYEIVCVASARYGKLPLPLRQCVLKYYNDKTTLKNKPTDAEHTAEFYELLYNKSKNLLNAQYGMMAQDPVKHTVLYDPEHAKDDDLYMEDTQAEEDLLNDYNKRAFLVYQWGVWVTARAREHLQKGIDICGINFVYCDTDSNKFIGDVDFTKLNKEEIKKSKAAGAYAKDSEGNIHYMGVFEAEGRMKQFKTMGSKKYAYIDMEGNLHITIAGVNKKIGAKELLKAGGLDAMKKDFVFKYAGGLEARYSDYPKTTTYITEDGVPIKITRNVSLVENTKTLGYAEDYEDLLMKINKYSIDL